MTPLTPAVLHILLSLAGGDKHGYGILKDVREQTNGRLRFGSGTLYGTLQRLMVDGWVEEARAPSRDVDERRRYYRLTKSGRSALEAELERLDDIVRLARAAGALPRPAGAGSGGSRG
jgi:DNA-binding PadR family transcriptional regulator